MKIQNVDVSTQDQERFARDFVQWQKGVQIVSIEEAQKKFSGIVKNYLTKNNSIPEIEFIQQGGVANGFYSLPKDKLILNTTGRNANVVAATAVHELEHAIQSRKVANLYAAKLAAQGKPVTVENIVNLSMASAMVPKFRDGKVQKDAKGNQLMELGRISMSPKVAKVAVADYKDGVRQTTKQADEAEKLRKDSYTPEAIQKRARLVIDLNSQIPNTPAYYAAEARYTDGLYTERQARDKEITFTKILQKVRNEQVVGQSALSDSDLSFAKVPTNDLTTASSNTSTGNTTVSAKSTSATLDLSQSTTSSQEKGATNVSKVVELLKENAAEIKKQYRLDVTTNEGLGQAVMQYWQENNLDPKTLREQLPDINDSEFETASKTVKNTSAKQVTKTDQLAM
jgi:hypothetical protein